MQAAGLPWTCDLTLAKNPHRYELSLLGQATGEEGEAVTARADPRFAAIDHCWVSPSWAAAGARCAAVQLIGDWPRDTEAVTAGRRDTMMASDHLGLRIELPLGTTAS